MFSPTKLRSSPATAYSRTDRTCAAPTQMAGARTQTYPDALPTTGELIRQLRYEAWAGALRPETFSHFMNATTTSKKSEKLAPSFPSTLFCAA